MVNHKSYLGHLGVGNTYNETGMNCAGGDYREQSI